MLRLPGLWRTWIAAVLLLSLPLQGLAAACMLGCSQGQAVAGQAAAAHGHHGPAVTTADSADNAPPHADAGHHGHQHSGHDATGHAADSDGGAASHGDSESDSGCSACAACFVGAAMPAGENVFSTLAPSQAVHAGHAPAVADTCPRGLKRPPRNRDA
jgi:hypothetical protein